MSNPFASIETALNAMPSVLSNATARIAGVFVDGVFAADYVNRMGIASDGPVFTCRTSDLPDVAYGSIVAVSYKSTSTAYTVAEVQADAAGVTVLLLK
jgi:hypothetical protein